MTSISKETLKDIHNHSFKNKEEILHSKRCVCFHCFKTYDADDIDTYLGEDDGKETALCPLCITDTVIGDACGYELTDEVVDALADQYLNGLTRDEMNGFNGPEIVELD